MVALGLLKRWTEYIPASRKIRYFYKRYHQSQRPQSARDLVRRTNCLAAESTMLIVNWAFATFAAAIFVGTEGRSVNPVKITSCPQDCACRNIICTQSGTICYYKRILTDCDDLTSMDFYLGSRGRIVCGGVEVLCRGRNFILRLDEMPRNVTQYVAKPWLECLEFLNGILFSTLVWLSLVIIWDIYHWMYLRRDFIGWKSWSCLIIRYEACAWLWNFGK